MGTNYYWHEKPACTACGHAVDPVHIGKSSHGWCFALHVYPEKGINDLPDWRKRFDMPGSWIKDEYGDAVSVHEMLLTITERDCGEGLGSRGNRPPPFMYKSWIEFHAKNQSSEGPNGLLRHGYGARPGAGTWDCCTGDFS